MTYYLEESGVIPYLETLGFGVVGYYILIVQTYKKSCTMYIKQYLLECLEWEILGMVA